MKVRNVAIIAHVDHGKTTLVDKLLSSSNTLSDKEKADRVMDSGDLERERGITITAKNTAINWKDTRINIVDTPGHADFGGEVERILSMVDSVLLLVDAVEGPMPQTRFVTQKAFAKGLKPIVVVNKIDRDGARPDWVIDQVFDLFVNLNASDEALDFDIIYTSALQGFATLDYTNPSDNMDALLDLICDKVPAPKVDANKPLQLQITSLDYSSFVGVIGVGRITSGELKANMNVVVLDRDGNQRKGKISQIYGYLGLNRHDIDEATAGDIVAIAGIPDLTISDTVCDPEQPEKLPELAVDEPTVRMQFRVNDSPLAGLEGKFVTSRQIWDRLEKEAIHNIALRIEQASDSNAFIVSGRGELHLGILIETMRREGFELAVGKPEVVIKTDENGEKLEPYEELMIEVEEADQGKIMEILGTRKGDLKNIVSDDKGRVRLEYLIATRGMIGFHGMFASITSGTGIMNHVFSHYGPMQKDVTTNRKNGALISMGSGVSTTFALFNLQPRGKLLIGAGSKIYEGMVIGIHAKDSDLVVNANKEKKLTNMRASGTDENMILTPPIKVTLEYAMEFIDDDELVEVTPVDIRIRKKYLKENERKRSGK